MPPQSRHGAIGWWLAPSCHGAGVNPLRNLCESATTVEIVQQPVGQSDE
ncbi:hypothetical protein H6F46_11695 [Limnothrix sp. FACHB-1083]|nr:hypothetical protein [Limnothrix sp. FACHB-1083]MBD2161353.1 hypothetical protein [Limnothrix sp. FACHB-1083]